MDIAVRTESLGRVADEALVLLGCEGDGWAARAGRVGASFAGPARTLVSNEGFAGKRGQVRVLPGGTKERVRLVVLAGCGSRKTLSDEALAEAAAEALEAARAAGAKSATVALPERVGGPGRVTEAARAVVEGAWLGLYRFERHKSKPSKQILAKVSVLVAPARRAAAARGVALGNIHGEATCFARDLANEPGNVATPLYLAEQARTLAEAEGLTCTIHDETALRAMGMGALLGVAQGSRQPPCLIELVWQPRSASRATPTVAIVGKGLTFDTGGISIKPAAKMEDMKFDMCGGAAVLGAMMAIARRKVPIRVVGIVAAAENMPDGNAYKPGDILRAMDGTTIEVKNTDAEGRLALADALCYVVSRVEPKPRAVVDLATLTGACLVALGNHHAALVSDNDSLAERLEAASQASGEAIWRLPLVDGHREQMSSVFADLSNLGTPGAGVLTAAAFLRHFAKDVPWAHLDIAGMAWTEKQKGTSRKGGTGYGVRLIADFLAAWKA